MSELRKCIKGRIRRCANWNDIVKKEEIKLLEQAVQLCEKPVYLVYLATSYVDCARSIHRNVKQLDSEMEMKIHNMNCHAKQLYLKAIQLKPDCAHLNNRCASGMLKMPRSLIDRNVIKNCIKVALEKAPNNGFVNHVTGMFAERHEHDLDKALYYYEISSALSVFGAMADYVRLKYMCDKDFNLIGALEDMLERSVSSPNRHKALSAIGSYYLFLKRDLFRSLHYYGRIMEEDSGSCAITANKPMFLSMRTPVNMYEIICTEIHLELNKSGLTDEEINLLKKFVKKLNQIDPLLSENFANRPSRIQQILDESKMLYRKYGTKARNLKSTARGRGSVFTNRARGRGWNRVPNLRTQVHSNDGHVKSTWRSKQDKKE